jgi:hypothetical protein
MSRWIPIKINKVCVCEKHFVNNLILESTPATEIYRLVSNQYPARFQSEFYAVALRIKECFELNSGSESVYLELNFKTPGFVACDSIECTSISTIYNGKISIVAPIVMDETTNTLRVVHAGITSSHAVFYDANISDVDKHQHILMGQSTYCIALAKNDIDNIIKITAANIASINANAVTVFSGTVPKAASVVIEEPDAQTIRKRSARSISIQKANDAICKNPAALYYKKQKELEESEKSVVTATTTEIAVKSVGSE